MTRVRASIASFDRWRRRASRHTRRLGIVAVSALLAAACGGGSDDPQALQISADPARTSPAPDGVVVDSEASSAYASLDLSFLDASASSSELPSAVPDGLEVGFTEEGHPYRGSADATVTLIEYSDYACPFCGRYTAQNVPALLEEYGVTGQVRFVFREFPLEGIHPTAPVAHAAALCAGEQGAGLYWAVHDEIFARQADWTQLPDPTEVLAEIASSVGVEMGAYAECVGSGRHDEEIVATVEEARSLGFNGTPSFVFTSASIDQDFTMIGARPLEEFSSWLDALLAGEPPPDDEAEQGEDEPAELPFWFSPEGRSADPDRVGFTRGGDPYRGSPEAPMTVIEFSDFQCPFCLQQYVESEPTTKAELIDTGQVMWIYKHLPLAIHEQAPLAAAAADCAGEQGRFWDMHDALFESVEQWGNENAEAVFGELALSIGLDAGRFTACLESRASLEGVVSDLFQARALGVQNAPSFVVFAEGQERGTLAEGFVEGDQFVRAIKSQLETVEG